RQRKRVKNGACPRRLHSIQRKRGQAPLPDLEISDLVSSTYWLKPINHFKPLSRGDLRHGFRNYFRTRAVVSSGINGDQVIVIPPARLNLFILESCFRQKRCIQLGPAV